MSLIKIECPSCRKLYNVEIEDGQTYDDMECPNCGGKIPVSPVQSASSEPLSAVSDGSDQLKCPWCQNIFTPPFDLKEHVGGMDCPACGKGMYGPLEQYLVSDAFGQTLADTTKNEASGGAHACTFFYVCAVIVFLIGQITAFLADVSSIITIDLNVSAVVLLLSAIYFKLPKPK